MAIGTATQWLFNFVFSQVTPHAIKNLGWRTFLMFCIFNWSLVLFAWLFIKETKGRSLEEINAGESQAELAACFPCFLLFVITDHRKNGLPLESATK